MYRFWEVRVWARQAVRPVVVRGSVVMLACVVAHAVPCAAAGVVPDGGTATTVANGASGRITVGVANAVGGVSTNTYREFNVPRGGVDLDNTAARARVILNQVTGTNPSLLEGQLGVLGPRANVVIANPNGINVNGMVVQNVGNLALTTGQVSFNDFTTANGQLQRNLVLNTQQGTIDIGPGGLSGTLLNLELIASRIRVGGKVENLFEDPGSRIRAVVGSSHAEIDASISPTDNLSRWIAYSTPVTNASSAVALDITAAGSLSAGRVELMVTDQGAGVRHAGAAFATVGDFVLSGTGDVQLAAGSVKALGDVLIGSGGLQGSGSIDAGRHLQLASARIDLNGSRLSAGTADVGDVMIGTPGQVHGGPIRLTDSTLVSRGGIGVFDGGGGLALAGTRLSADGNIVVDTTSLTAAAATLTSQQGVVSIKSGNAALRGTQIDGVGGTTIAAADIALQDAEVRSSGAAVSMTATGSYTQLDSNVLAATDASVQAGAIGIRSGTRQSSVIASQGGVLLRSAGDIVNTGGLIQGQSRRAAQPLARGAVTLDAGGAILNDSTLQYLGILFGANDDVSVRARGDIVNRHARMLSNALLDVDAGGDLVNAITKQPGANGELPVLGSASGRRWLVFSRRSATFDIDYGVADRPDQVAYLLSDRGTTLRGRNVINTGGEIYANHGAITIRAEDTFSTTGVATGAAHYSRTCMIVCRTSASSTTGVSGGLLSAGGDIDIRAGSVASNIGGRVLAIGNLTVDAPQTYAGGVTGYVAIARDRGFKVFFGDTWARLYATDIGGSWMATGHTRVTGDAVVDGGSLDGDVTIAGTQTVVRPRQQQPVSVESHLGLTSWIWR